MNKNNVIYKIPCAVAPLELNYLILKDMRDFFKLKGVT